MSHFERAQPSPEHPQKIPDRAVSTQSEIKEIPDATGEGQDLPLHGEHPTEPPKMDRAGHDNVNGQLYVDTWHDPEEVYEIPMIGFDVETQDVFLAQGQKPISVSYRLNEDGSIREFVKIQFLNEYGNYDLMRAVKSRFESHGIPVDESEDGHLTIAPEVLSNPGNLENLKQALQVTQVGSEEYVGTFNLLEP